MIDLLLYKGYVFILFSILKISIWKISTEQLQGTMIRVNDGGRFNKKFVEEKVEEIIELLGKNVGNEVVIL